MYNDFLDNLNFYLNNSIFCNSKNILGKKLPVFLIFFKIWLKKKFFFLGDSLEKNERISEKIKVQEKTRDFY